MNSDDLEPMKKKKVLKNLDEMSVEALGDYIAELEGEITRARDAIAAKNNASSDAESFFKS